MVDLNYRFTQILEMIPKDAESVLDVGCDKRELETFFKKYIGLDKKNAEILQDLNFNQKLPLKDKCVDIVLLSQILEHLSDPTELIAESKRVSKKYVLVGLPSEVTIDNRIRILFNKFGRGYDPFGHKHFFNPKDCEKFVQLFFDKWDKKQYVFAVKGGRFLPQPIRQIMADFLPNLFAKEIYFLIKL